MNRFTPFLDDERPGNDRFCQGLLFGSIGTALLMTIVAGLNFFIF